MATAATIAIQLVLDMTQYKKGLGDAEGEAQAFANKMTMIGEKVGDIGKAMSLAITVPTIAFLTSSVSAALESENAMADLQATIASTGGAAGLTAEQVADMAANLQDMTAFEDDAIIKGQAMLLTFTNIGEKTFPRASMAMLNMAQKFGSMEAASVQLGKALNDPIQGVMALRRVGVMLSDEQEAQIRHFMDINDIASAQGVILDELDKEFGGLAEAMGKTNSGQMAQFKNNLDDLQEKLGKVMLPFLIKLVNGLDKLVSMLEKAPPWVQQLIVVFLLLVAAMGPVLMLAGWVIQVIGALSGLGITAASISSIVAALGTAFTTFAGVITGTLLPALASIVAAALPIVLPILAIIAVVYLVYLAFKNNFGGITTTVQQLWFIITYYFGLIWNTILSIRDGAVALYEDGSGALLGLATAFGFPQQAAQDFLSTLWQVINGGVDAWRSLTSFIQLNWLALTLLLKGDTTAAMAAIKAAFSKLGIDITSVINRIKSVWQSGMAFLQSVASRIFNGIVTLINNVMAAIERMKSALMSIKAPAFLTPGSPTPFERGLLGVSQAMQTISDSSIPKLQLGMASLSPSPLVGALTSGGSSGGVVHYVDNRRFDSRISAEDRLRQARDTEALFRKITGVK